MILFPFRNYSDIEFVYLAVGRALPVFAELNDMTPTVDITFSVSMVLQFKPIVLKKNINNVSLLFSIKLSKTTGFH